jgi:hypothetical protein
MVWAEGKFELVKKMQAVKACKNEEVLRGMNLEEPILSYRQES